MAGTSTAAARALLLAALLSCCYLRADGAASATGTGADLNYTTDDAPAASSPDAPLLPLPKPADPTLLPITVSEALMFVVAAVVLFIAAGAGVGGGPVLVPAYLLLGQLSNVAAVALSNVTILSGSVANTCFNVFKRHPFKPRPLIDYDLILLLQPPTSLGARAARADATREPAHARMTS